MFQVDWHRWRPRSDASANTVGRPRAKRQPSHFLGSGTRLAERTQPPLFVLDRPSQKVGPISSVITLLRNQYRYGPAMELGYARVSTAKQDLDRQIDALLTAGIDPQHIYRDKKSGSTVDRPGLAAVLQYARSGDVIVVHTLDRLGRTVRDTLNMIHELAERGVGVRNLADPIKVDSSNPSDPDGAARGSSIGPICSNGADIHARTGRARPSRCDREGSKGRSALGGQPESARLRPPATRRGRHYRRDRGQDRNHAHQPVPASAAPSTRTRSPSASPQPKAHQRDQGLNGSRCRPTTA